VDLIDLMATYVVPVDDWALDFDIENRATLLAEKMVMGFYHAVVTELGTGDRDGRNKILLNKGIQGVVYCGHRHCRYSLDECLVYCLDSRVRVHMTFKIFEDFEPLIRRLQSFVGENFFQSFHICNHFHLKTIIIKE